MDDSDRQNGFGIGRLSLIDVSFEDDCLISSPIGSPLHHPFSENQGCKSVKFLEPFDASNGEMSFNSIEERKDEPQPLESPEPEKTKPSGKYNLRKSLAWDNAFFTNEGVLDSDELCSMMGGTEKSEKHILPGIQEDIHRSTDSLSTLESDTLTSKSLEVDLFEDIRASIQKSSKLSDVVNSNCKKKSGVSESQSTQSSRKADCAPQDKVKPKAAPKKPNFGTPGSGIMTKRIPVRPQTSQSISAKRESTSSLHKPPKIQSRANPASTGVTKRASLSTNHVKTEKDNAKNASGRVVSVSKIPSTGGARNPRPKPTLPTRLPLRSSVAMKKELTTSCSSLESSCSGSSDSFGKLPLNMKRKINSGTRNPPSSSTAKSLSRVAPKSKDQRGSSNLESSLRSVNKLSSSISPSSSISEWSPKSSSSTSTVHQVHAGARSSMECSPFKRLSAKVDTAKNFDHLSQSNEQCTSRGDTKVPGSGGGCTKGTSTSSTVASLRAASTKPSGLRLPSPKIGFFDGVKSAMRTPNGSTPSASPKVGTGRMSSSGGLNKAKPVKSQPPKTAIASCRAKPDTQQAALIAKHKSPSPLQQLRNDASKVSGVSKSVKSPVISPKVQGELSPKIGGESHLKVEETKKEHQKSTPDFGFAEMNDSRSKLKGKASPEKSSKEHVMDIKSSPLNERLAASILSNPTSDVKNVNPSPIARSKDTNLLHRTNEKEGTPFGDKVDSPARKLKASPEKSSEEHVMDIKSSPLNEQLDASILSNPTCDAENVNPAPTASKDTNLLHKTNQKEGSPFGDKVDSLSRKLKASPEKSSEEHITDIKSNPLNERLDASIHSNPTGDAENVNPSPVASKDGNLLDKTNEKEWTPFGNKVDSLTRKLQAMKINVEPENNATSLNLDSVLIENN